ncbi:MAG: acetyl-CoA carboxylase, carboxyltransferase subunit beta [Clostridiales bacterium]|nr:acetyl-CoA carboxylase, carboxyltransferase subunit beta [Clostridiales bacterium]
MNLFKKRIYIPVNSIKEDTFGSVPIVPDGLWLKCPYCGKTIYRKELGKYNVCPYCGGHLRIGAYERLGLVLDKDAGFIEFDKDMKPLNPLNYPEYEEKNKKFQKSTGLYDAIVTGLGKIVGYDTIICAMDSNYIMGSMGSVVGEKLTRAIEYATLNNLPVIVFTASGGARMQEGILSLMQMAKVSAALAKHSEKSLLYVPVLTDPTTGGVTASFAMLGDIILAEPKATIGFAGRRVIEQTIKQELPEGFQTSEFLLEHGFIDKIVSRPELRDVISKILKIHLKPNYS